MFGGIPNNMKIRGCAGGYPGHVVLRLRYNQIKLVLQGYLNLTHYIASVS